MTNLVIHLLNGLLVYWLTVLLFGNWAIGAGPGRVEAGWSAMSGYLPLLVASAWLLHPLQLTSVLYVVQRMTSLSSFFVLSGLVLFVLGRRWLEEGRGAGLVWMFAGLAGGGLLGFFSKENGALVLLFAVLVELYFFRREGLSKLGRRRLGVFYGLVVGVPVVLGVLHIVMSPGSVLRGYGLRDFGPYERILTQSRVLFFYLGLLVFPSVREYGLYHDDIATSVGLFAPWTTVLSMVLWGGGLVGASVWGMRRRSLWSFGLLWYLVGHGMESSIIALEMVHEHRNYIPSYGVVLALVYYLLRTMDRAPGTRRLKYPLMLAGIAVLAFLTFTRAFYWQDLGSLVTVLARNHPQSPRSQNLWRASRPSSMVPMSV